MLIAIQGMRAPSRGRLRSSKTPFGRTALAPFRRAYGFPGPIWPARGARCRRSSRCSKGAAPSLIPSTQRAACVRHPLLLAIHRGLAQPPCHPSLAPCQSTSAHTRASDQRRQDLRSSPLIPVTALSLVALARTLRSRIAQATRATRLGRFDRPTSTTLASVGTAATRRHQ